MRVKIGFPARCPLSTLRIPVRIGDINYGGHVGNDAILSIIHEARMQWLTGAGFSEMNVGGHGLIMADVIIAYRNESFYGDVLQVELFAEDITSRSFSLLYRITTLRNNQSISIADAKTGMICYDYTARQIITMSNPLKTLLSSPNNPA